MHYKLMGPANQTYMNEMIETTQTQNTGIPPALGQDYSDVIDSRFRLIVVAALRAKQLLHGSYPRIEANPQRRRNTSIALEEVKRGLVPFSVKSENMNKE